jgi:tetratricopeptide (TPR) repeat protein/CHAT domain-containing protein
LTGQWIPRGAALIARVVLMVIGAPMKARAQRTDAPSALNKHISDLYSAGKFGEAIPLAEKSLELTRTQRGPDHLDTAARMLWLALLYQSQGRYAETEPLFKGALAINEKALGPDHPDVGVSLASLALLYRAQGRYAEAEPLYKRSLAIREKALGPDHADVGTVVNNLADLYRAQGRYADAEPLMKRALAIAERALGPDHPDVGASLASLALLYESQGRYAEAEPLFKRQLAINEEALGADHADVGKSLNNLAYLYSAQGRYTDAEPLFKRALAINEKALGVDHADVGTVVNNLADLYRAQGRHADAEPLLKRSLAIIEKALGPDHPDVGLSLNNLAGLYRDQGRYAEAEPLYTRDMAISQRTLGPDHPEVGRAFGSLALLYRHQGRYAEAEPLFKQAIAIMEKALGPDHQDVGLSLYNLAALYQEQGRYAEAEPLEERALAIREKAFGPDHPEVGESRGSLAQLYQSQGRYGEAEALFKQALSISEKALGPDHPNVGISLNNLAEFYRAHGRYGEAELLSKQALAITEKALGPDHDYVGRNLVSLAGLYRVQGRYAEAEQLLKRSLAIIERAFGSDHPDVSVPLNGLAVLSFEQLNWQEAADYWRRSTGVIVRRAQRGASDKGKSQSGKQKSEAERSSWQFRQLVKAVYRLLPEGPSADANLAREVFQTAQWGLASDAAASLAQMAARGANGDPRLAAVVRERQDLIAEWQQRDGVRTATVSLTPQQRDRAAEAANVARLAEIDRQLANIDQLLRLDFPDYAAFSRPEPLSVEQVQADLRPDEALILLLDTPVWNPTPEETFIWVVTKTDMRWVRSELGTPSLQREVAALRCGLDYDGTWGASGSRCADLLKISYADVNHQNGMPLPFDRDRAYALYRTLFGQIEDIINDKHLLIVPSGALTQLPFQVLLTEKSDAANGDDTYRRAAWLIRKHPLTVLPSVSSLKALRELAKDSRASRAMIGFGNPLLDGPDVSYGRWAAAARSKQSCPAAPKQRVGALSGERHRGVLPLELRRGLADVAQIRMQVPLPETADELCAVAHDLRVDSKDIWLGARATEADIKRLSDTGELSSYRIIHFATHGALAGEVSGNSEPGLLLTPPDKATEGDDGYLSASEITALKLDADWVILSACNTAAARAEGAEALSGLARAFFYAGARALLVSHWAVYSDATVKLITGAVGRMAANKAVGRAEALRQSMLALIDNGKANETHPSYWAPFVVVGEGRVDSSAALSSSAAHDLFSVQVASDRSRAQALEVFAKLQRRHASLLKGAQADVQEVDLGAKGVWHRLLIGPAVSKADAEALCRKLKSDGLTTACLIMPR